MADDAPQVIPAVREYFADRLPFNRFLGIEVAALRRGFCRLELPFRDELVGDPDRPALHGGVLSTLVDTAGGAAAMSMIDSPGDRVSTIDLRVDYLRPGNLERLAAEATVSRMGNKVACVDVRCFHPSDPDRLIVTAKAVYNVWRVSGDPAAE